MAVFSYQGCDATGASETGTIEANSKKIAFETLQSRGITVFELSLGARAPEPSLPWYRRDLKLTSGALSYEDQAVTAGLLAVLFEASLTSMEIVRIAGLSSERPEIQRHFERVGQRVADGTAFADAFDAENRLFSPIFVSFLQVGDTANAQAGLLKELAQFFQKQNEVQQKVVSALIYPAILVAAAIMLLLIVVLYLAPNLEPIFASVGKEPPGTLGVLLSMNSLLRDFWPVFVGGGAGLMLGLLALAQIPAIASKIARLRYRLPIFGKLAQLSALSRLSQATHLLLRSGQTLADALRVSAEIMGKGSGFDARFTEAADSIEAGYSAAAIFDGDPIIPASFKELFRIGEETNRLSSTLSALSASMAAQVDRQAQRLLNLLTPALTLVLGLGIGFLIYTLMGAILEVNELAF